MGSDEKKRGAVDGMQYAFDVTVDLRRYFGSECTLPDDQWRTDRKTGGKVVG